MQISKIQVGKKLNVIFYQGFCFMSRAGRDQHFCCAQMVAGDTNFEESLVFGARARGNRGLFRSHELRHIWINRQQPRFRLSKPLMILARLTGRSWALVRTRSDIDTQPSTS
jgi:hypothetical protein